MFVGETQFVDQQRARKVQLQENGKNQKLKKNEKKDFGFHQSQVGKEVK
jgi:hypothetical protein